MNAMRTLILASLLLAVALPAWAQASSNKLTWTDNATNEANFNIERGTAATVAACQTGVTFAPLITISANLVSFTDLSVNEGTVYCYRVNASNTAGPSPYSNIAGRLVPPTVPLAPSALGVVGGP